KYFFDEDGRIQNIYDFDVKKKNIILLGDSQVEALMVENENVIHNSLYREINGKYNVLNYGLSGTGPSQQLEILKTKVDLKNIDTLIHFVFLENDLNDGDPKNFNEINRPKVYYKFKNFENYEIIKPRVYNIKEKIRDFLGHFELYVYLKKTFYFYSSHISNFFKEKREVVKVLVNDKKYILDNEEYKWTQLEGSIYQINKIAKKMSFKYKIIIFSTFEDDGYLKNREKFQVFLNKQNISHSNIAPFLKQLSSKQKIDFSCDGHWNENTHQAIAKYLKKELKL
ncbi:hypothetical protein JHD48_05575, partial [Sulfurimonas sp. SAG-AH-194-I05]